MVENEQHEDKSDADAATPVAVSGVGVLDKSVALLDAVATADDPCTLADQEGTPQQVQKVVDTVRANKIPVVFSESTISDKAMRQVAKEPGARFGGVLYVD